MSLLIRRLDTAITSLALVSIITIASYYLIRKNVIM